MDLKSSRRISVLHVAEAGGGVDRYLKPIFKYIDRNVSKIIENDRLVKFVKQHM